MPQRCENMPYHVLIQRFFLPLGNENRKVSHQCWWLVTVNKIRTTELEIGYEKFSSPWSSRVCRPGTGTWCWFFLLKIRKFPNTGSGTSWQPGRNLDFEVSCQTKWETRVSFRPLDNDVDLGYIRPAWQSIFQQRCRRRRTIQSHGGISISMRHRDWMESYRSSCIPAPFLIP